LGSVDSRRDATLATSPLRAWTQRLNMAGGNLKEQKRFIDKSWPLDSNVNANIETHVETHKVRTARDILQINNAQKNNQQSQKLSPAWMASG
jgi:hypothetical protein